MERDLHQLLLREAWHSHFHVLDIRFILKKNMLGDVVHFITFCKCYQIFSNNVYRFGFVFFPVLGFSLYILWKAVIKNCQSLRDLSMAFGHHHLNIGRLDWGRLLLSQSQLPCFCFSQTLSYYPFYKRIQLHLADFFFGPHLGNCSP